ncbi:MAG TPA: C40 family peptidase, partial [Draconibacterium sp.]|nr:C40 family peptidase [Draconibacterium sp.]
LDVWKQKQVDVEKVLSTAFLFKGTPYLWGGTSPKMFDCSGFTKTVYYMQGLILQRDASQQTLYGELVDTYNGYENLEPGDLLFFGRKETAEQPEKVTHVGLYIGGMKFIHASGKVRINSLDPNSEDYTEYYEKAFVRARRVIINVDGKGIDWIVDNEFYRQILSE